MITIDERTTAIHAFDEYQFFFRPLEHPTFYS